MLQFDCPSCQRRCQATPDFAGKLVVCPNCGQSVAAPRDSLAITEAAPPPPLPKREPFAADDRSAGPSIAKDGGAAAVLIRNGVSALVVLSVLGLCVCLLLPATNRTHGVAARTQSTSNLKQIALACQSFHDGNKRMPFNGSDISPKDMLEMKYQREAEGGNYRSGSWAFQILPYIDQAPTFVAKKPRKQAEGSGIATFMCPRRGRPAFEDNQAANVGGPWTDFFLNNYLNDPLQAARPDAPDMRRTFVGITDGTSNTILAGHGNINTTQYGLSANVAGSSNIFTGGTAGTMRSGDNGAVNPTGVTFQRDSAENPGIGSWGGPFPQGGLMAMCDGTVRMFPYGMQNFSAFLTPTGKEEVTLPDT